MRGKRVGGSGAALISTAVAIVIACPVQAKESSESAVLAGGCFWGMEAVFEHVRGVRSVVAGYAGGTAADANYSAVSSERTNHAEAVRINFDPAQNGYAHLSRSISPSHMIPPSATARARTPDGTTARRCFLSPWHSGDRRSTI